MKESKMITGIINEVETKLKSKIVAVNQIALGYVNDVFIIQTSHAKTYVLKCYHLSDTKKISLSIALQEFLYTKNLSPQVMIKGEKPVQYIVQEYIDNNRFAVDWKLFGKTLGILHFSLKNYNEIKVEDFLPIRDSSNLLVSIRHAQELFYLKERLRKIIHYPELDDRQFIHGDYTWKNILQKDDRCYSVIDFDEAKKYYSIYDVSKVVFDMIFSNSNCWDDILTFLNAYQSICTITYLEKKEMLNVYAYTLTNDFSGIDDSFNKDKKYLEKRIIKHKKILKCFDEYDEIMRRIGW